MPINRHNENMLKQYLNENKISVYQLAKQTGIPRSTLSDIVNGSIAAERCMAGNLFRIAQALNLSIDQVFLLCQPAAGKTVSVKIGGTEVTGEITQNGKQFFVRGTWQGKSFLRPVCRAFSRNMDFLEYMARTALMNMYFEERKLSV